VLQARERTPTSFPFNVFTFGLIVESIKELRGALAGIDDTMVVDSIIRTTCISLSQTPFEF
jgi:hypothetical protein